MFAKVFSQIYDSSIVENPETRFTFMDFLILADCNGVVDMTHEAIARRTNRPIEVIRETIAELESPDHRSRTPDFDGSRIKRLDDHRDWGWFIVNFDRFRKIASEEQRREKTKMRMRKLRSVTLCDAPLRSGDDLPSPSASSSVSVYPSLQEALDYGKAHNPVWPDQVVKIWHATRQSNDWEKASGVKLRPANWHSDLDAWALREARGDHQQLAAKRQSYGTRNNAGESNRNIGTANEGKSSQYAGVGKI